MFWMTHGLEGDAAACWSELLDAWKLLGRSPGRLVGGHGIRDKPPAIAPMDHWFLGG